MAVLLIHQTVIGLQKVNSMSLVKLQLMILVRSVDSIRNGFFCMGVK